MNSKLVTRAEEIVAGYAVHTKQSDANPYCVLSLLDEEGYPTASTITLARAEGLRRLTFCSGLRSNKARRIAESGRASVCFSAQDHNITLVGTMVVRTDPQLKRAAWYRGMEQHFSGPDHPDYCVLLFQTQRYSLLVDWQEEAGALPPGD